MISISKVAFKIARHQNDSRENCRKKTNQLENEKIKINQQQFIANNNK